MSSASSRMAAADPSSRPAGSGGVGGTTSEPWVQATSARRRSNAGHASGHRHGASGARSRLHFRTVSPFGYERLSKFLHSVRIGTPPCYGAMRFHIRHGRAIPPIRMLQNDDGNGRVLARGQTSSARSNGGTNDPTRRNHRHERVTDDQRDGSAGDAAQDGDRRRRRRGRRGRPRPHRRGRRSTAAALDHRHRRPTNTATSPTIVDVTPDDRRSPTGPSALSVGGVRAGGHARSPPTSAATATTRFRTACTARPRWRPASASSQLSDSAARRRAGACLARVRRAGAVAGPTPGVARRRRAVRRHGRHPVVHGAGAHDGSADAVRFVQLAGTADERRVPRHRSPACLRLPSQPRTRRTGRWRRTHRAS